MDDIITTGEYERERVINRARCAAVLQCAITSVVVIVQTMYVMMRPRYPKFYEGYWAGIPCAGVAYYCLVVHKSERRQRREIGLCVAACLLSTLALTTHTITLCQLTYAATRPIVDDDAKLTYVYAFIATSCVTYFVGIAVFNFYVVVQLYVYWRYDITLRIKNSHVAEQYHAHMYRTLLTTVLLALALVLCEIVFACVTNIRISIYDGFFVPTLFLFKLLVVFVFKARNKRLVYFATVEISFFLMNLVCIATIGYVAATRYYRCTVECSSISLFLAKCVVGIVVLVISSILCVHEMFVLRSLFVPNNVQDSVDSNSQDCRPSQLTRSNSVESAVHDSLDSSRATRFETRSSVRFFIVQHGVS